LRSSPQGSTDCNRGRHAQQNLQVDHDSLSKERRCSPHLHAWRLYKQTGLEGGHHHWHTELPPHLDKAKGKHEDPRPREHFSLVIRTVDHIIGGCDLFHAFLGEHLVDQVSEVQLLHGVACCAHLTVHFITSTHTRDVMTVEDGLEPERIARWVRWVLVLASAHCWV